MTDYLVPLILFFTMALALGKRENAYARMLGGAKQGLYLMASIATSLILLLTTVKMMQSSGAAEAAGGLLKPIFAFFGIPPETALLVLVRPFSGSAALAVGAELMARYGVDSQIGRTAAVMLGSTETTFYTIAVYFGSAGIVRTRHTVPAALAADFTGFLAAALTVRLFFGT